MNILHLSDLHLSSRTSWDSKPILTSLAKVVEKLNSELAPDIVAITGDLANTGTKDDYAMVADWIKNSLLPAMPGGFTPDRILVVAGNHDVDRSRISKGTKALQDDLLLDRNQLAIGDCLKDEQDSSLLLNRLNHYAEFCTSVLGCEDDFPWWRRRFEINGVASTFVGLCSALFSSGDNDKGRLVVSKYQWSTLTEDIPPEDYVITLIHHPFSYLADFDSDDTEYGVRGLSDLVLRGHLHRQESILTTDTGTSVVELAGGAVYESSQHPNTFQLISIDESGSSIIRSWIWVKNRWRENRMAFESGATTTILLKSDTFGMLAAESVQHPPDAVVTQAKTTLPSPPKADIVHPYPMQSHFTGRMAECKALLKWLNQGTESVMCIVAIGGMGKSSLSWHWWTKHVRPGLQSRKREESDYIQRATDGVLWWSFYEFDAAFTSFLNETVHYLSHRKLRLSNFSTPSEAIRYVVEALRQRNVLLVLDGFERELQAYSGLNSALQEDADRSIEVQRQCTHPLASQFVRAITSVQLRGRVLITSRLFPRELESEEGRTLPGAARFDLTSLSPNDAVSFFRAYEIKGTDQEIRRVCANCGFHPLALRLLCGLILYDTDRPGEMKAYYYDEVARRMVPRRNNILQISYDALNEVAQDLLSRIAAFKSPVAFDAVRSIAVSNSNRIIRRTLDELRDRGLISFDNRTEMFDLHPMVRRYAYDRLANKKDLHQQLSTYFDAMASGRGSHPETVSDIQPLIELYHHTIQSGDIARGCEILAERLIPEPIFSRFSDMRLCVELLSLLFDNDEPRLSGSGRAWLCNEFGNALSLSGNTARP